MIAVSLPVLIQSKLEHAVEHLNQTVILNRAAMRNLLLELRPEAIVNERLPRLFEHLLNAASGRKPIETQLIVDGEQHKLPAELQIALFRIVQEAINNAKKLIVRLNEQPNHIFLQIEDDGSEFGVRENLCGMGRVNVPPSSAHRSRWRARWVVARRSGWSGGHMSSDASDWRKMSG